jgi:proteasome beta subunit
VDPNEVTERRLRRGWEVAPGAPASLRAIMQIPRFAPDDDPGPSFTALLDRAGLVPPPLTTPMTDQLIHATTCVAVRYQDGVVMAGDRRATSGHLISHRTMEKVFPADRFSGVAIAGAAGPAMEMVKLFQLQLEHYEKVEGNYLSLEGKANQLGQMVRQNLPAAMQGLAVVPLFAGYDVRRQQGRLFQYDVTGGRYEESNFASTGSGSLHAGTVIKLGYKTNADRAAAIDLVISALFQAADEDSATGGPDLVRGIYPTVATITTNGFDRVPEEEIADRFRSLVDTLATPDGVADVGIAPTVSNGGGATR